eukprot:GEMP01010352.1.p1 GENE.GEMP01010352.1~~GEMP01010352.1.p1  ORF type:complete len:1059 (+),score=251.31 GEMP01010352.1:76-3252(+)
MVVPGPSLTLPDAWNDETKTGRWVYKEVLGEGGFGVVHQALDMKNGGKAVAIKILRCGKDGYRHCLLGTKEVRQARLFQEKVYSKTKHRLFLQYLEDHTGLDSYSDEELRVFEQPDFDWETDARVQELHKKQHPYLVMELIKGRCVKALTKERKLSPGEIRELMHQASAALWHLFKQQKIHRDFRVHNMMWSEGKLTIIDFGLVLSAEPQHADSKNRLVRTYWKLDSYWMPPEVKKPQLKSQQATFVPYNFAKNCPSSFDMYSFGVMALELLLDASVNAKMARNQNAIEGKGLKRLRPLDAVKFADEAKLKAVGLSRHILSLCCARNPAHRPTPEMLLKGFQSEFPQGPTLSPQKEQFYRHLHAVCGQQRADKGMKMLGFLAREIVHHATQIDDYVDAMVMFTTEPNVSIYRLLCIVDCACRSGVKWAKAPNTMELVISAFAKVIKKMMESARALYAADTASNKFNRQKVIEFAKKWKAIKLFERQPDGKRGSQMVVPAAQTKPVAAVPGKPPAVPAALKEREATSRLTTQCPPTSNEDMFSSEQAQSTKDKMDQRAAQIAAKKKAAAAKKDKEQAAQKKDDVRSSPAADIDALSKQKKDKDAGSVVSSPKAKSMSHEPGIGTTGAGADKDHVRSCESIGSIGTWSSFTCSALTVKSTQDMPDVDILSSSEEVVDVASRTADDMSSNRSVSSERSESESSREVTKKPGARISKAWWVDSSDDRGRYTNRKKIGGGNRRQGSPGLAKKWFIEHDAPRYTRKKVLATRRAQSETSSGDSSSARSVSSVKPLMLKANRKQRMDSMSSSVSSPPRKQKPAATRRNIARTRSSSSESVAPVTRRQPRAPAARNKRRASPSSSKRSASVSFYRQGRRSGSSGSPRSCNAIAKKKRAASSSASSRDSHLTCFLKEKIITGVNKKRLYALPDDGYTKRARRPSNVPPPTRRRGSPGATRPNPGYRSRSRSPPPPPPPVRRNKPRNCLAEDSESEYRSPNRHHVVLVPRKNVSPRRSNTNGNTFGGGLFPKFPELRDTPEESESPLRRRHSDNSEREWRLGVPWKRR